MAQPTGGPSYEAARDELLEVVRQLEAGGLPLEQSLTLWERGEELAAHLSGLARRREASGLGRARPADANADSATNDDAADANDPPETPDRNLALELVRVTEAAAMAAGRWVGLGEKNDADAAAVDAMRRLIGTVVDARRRRDRRRREGRRPDALQR